MWLLTVTTLAGAENLQDLAAKWEEFKETFVPVFTDSDEEEHRFSVFQQNMAEAAKLQKAEPWAKFGVTKFSHLTKGEFLAMNGFAQSENGEQQVGTVPFSPYTLEQLRAVPSSVDWREKGAVTPIKDQGQCGSCYAFSTTGNIEGVSAVAGNPLVSLSEQLFVSCVAVTPPGGQCHGGLPKLDFQWLLDNRDGDVLTEAAYPYGSHDFWSPPCTGVCHAVDPTQSDWCSTSCYCFTPLCPSETCDCKSDGQNVGAKISGWTALPSDEDQMKAYLAEHGPISIGVSTSGGFQHYQEGIISNCAPDMVDHAVLLVGFTEDYWIIKNSWNTDWGESGFMRAQFGTNQCNLNHQPTSAVVDAIIV